MSQDLGLAGPRLLARGRIATLIMSLCTSIPATYSYITFIPSATSCSGNPLPMGTRRAGAGAADQYRRLTHAHAAAAGVPGMGLQRHSLLRPRTVQTVTATAAARHCNCAPPAPPASTGRGKNPGRPRPETRQRRKGTQFSSHHGRAAKRRMYTFTGSGIARRGVTGDMGGTPVEGVVSDASLRTVPVKFYRAAPPDAIPAGRGNPAGAAPGAPAELGGALIAIRLANLVRRCPAAKACARRW